MSTQEQKLAAIADAIREKDGTTEPIPANDFPERIRAIQGGGGIELESISIVAPPDRVRYQVGERFDPAGMEIRAVYSNGAVATATGWLCTPSGELTEGDAKITVQYTEQGVTRTAEQPIKVILRWLYGFDINNADSSPATRVSYPTGVDNAGFAAAKMDFDADVFSYGGWPSAPGNEFMPRPCMLSFDGTVAYYLNPDDYTKKADGTPSDVADINFGGNAMMEWPKIYTKRWETGGVYHFRCSNDRVDEDYECWCNYDRLDNEIPHFYTPIFFGCLDGSGRMRSISGQPNRVHTSAQMEVDAAKLNGADIWYTEVLADRELINDLLVMIFKSTDLQAAAGMGVAGASAALTPGTMNTKGMFWGSDEKTSGVKVFGMEHWWGNLWRRIAGWMYVGSVQKVKLTRGTKDGTTVDDYNITGDGYLAISDSAMDGDSGGYISVMKTERYGRFPKTLHGSGTTFETDAFYYSYANEGYAGVGGRWSHGLSAGPFDSALHNRPTAADENFGSALSCKPLASVQNA